MDMYIFTTIMSVLTECVFVQRMSACSISLCPWKYNLASSSLRLFKTFSQHSHPNSEPCFLSFSFTAHYPGHVEETVLRERGEGESLREGQQETRERKRMGKSESKPDRKKKRQREWISDWKRENVDFLWTWPWLLVLLMNGEEREGRETPRQDCLCCA